MLVSPGGIRWIGVSCILGEKINSDPSIKPVLWKEIALPNKSNLELNHLIEVVLFLLLNCCLQRMLVMQLYIAQIPQFVLHFLFSKRSNIRTLSKQISGSTVFEVIIFFRCTLKAPLSVNNGLCLQIYFLCAWISLSWTSRPHLFPNRMFTWGREYEFRKHGVNYVALETFSGV